MFKNMRLVNLFHMFLDPSFKMTISFANVARLILFSQTHFFNSKIYNQIDGVAMGFPLAPVLANIFMGFYESKWPN